VKENYCFLYWSKYFRNGLNRINAIVNKITSEKTLKNTVKTNPIFSLPMGSMGAKT